MQGQFYHISTRQQLDNLHAVLEAQYQAGNTHGFFVQIAVGKKARTAKQQNAIEVFCRDAADALNGAGFDMVKFFKAMRDGAQIPWSQASVKEDIWRVIQKPLTGKTSTTALDTAEVNQVYEVVHARVLAERGLYVPFPSQGGNNG